MKTSVFYITLREDFAYTELSQKKLNSNSARLRELRLVLRVFLLFQPMMVVPLDTHTLTSKVNDTIKLNLESNQIEETIKFGAGCLVMVTGGRSTGRVGILKEIEKHPGSHHIVYVEDLAGRSFATRLDNVFALGVGRKALVSLPRGGGVKLGIVEARNKQRQVEAAAAAQVTTT